MSAYPPPINTFSGEYYNPISYVSIGENVALVNKANDFTLLQSCSATQPSLQDNSTIIPSTAWVQNVVINAQQNGAQTDESNTFTELQYCSATMPVSTDASDTIVTSEFTQEAITTALTNYETDYVENSHTYTQLQYCNATMPNYNDNTSTIPNTLFVQNAINNQAVLLSTNQTIYGNKSFLGICSGVTNSNPADNSTQISTNQFVQNAIQNLTGNASIIVASMAQSTQTWSFMQTGHLTANYYTFVLYSSNYMFGSGTSSTASGGTVTSVTGNILATGMCSTTVFINSYTGDGYSWNQICYGWMPKIIATQGSVISNVSLTFGTTSENDATNPPTAGTYSGSYMTITLSAPNPITETLYCQFIPVG